MTKPYDNFYRTYGKYKGAVIYEDTLGGFTVITTNLHGLRRFKSIRAAKIAITKWG